MTLRKDPSAPDDVVEAARLWLDEPRVILGIGVTPKGDKISLPGSATIRAVRPARHFIPRAELLKRIPLRSFLTTAYLSLPILQYGG